MVQTEFIRTHTALAPVRFVPEIVLYQADEPITLWEKTEADGIDRPPPFWAFAWAGGQALARHILDHPELVAGRQVLDLATGSGLVAIAAALAGARAVTANDIDPLSLAAAETNAAANRIILRTLQADLLTDIPPVDPLADVPQAGIPQAGIPQAGIPQAGIPQAGIPQAGIPHIGNPQTGFPPPGADDRPDVVLAGDVFYSREMAARVLPFLQRAAGRGALVLIGDPGRAYLPRSGLIPQATYKIPVPEALETVSSRDTTIWRFPAPPGPVNP